MKYAFKRTFEKSLKGKRRADREDVGEAINILTKSIEAGEPPPEGLGLTHLRSAYWEIRSSLKLRIFFEWQSDIITFYFAGNHEDVRRFLKRR